MYIRKLISSFFLYFCSNLYIKEIMSTELSEQEQFRRQSLDELRNLGIDPYPAALYPTDAFSTDIKAEFKDEESGKNRLYCRPYYEPPHYGQSFFC